MERDDIKLIKILSVGTFCVSFAWKLGMQLGYLAGNILNLPMNRIREHEHRVQDKKWKKFNKKLEKMDNE